MDTLNCRLMTAPASLFKTDGQVGFPPFTVAPSTNLPWAESLKPYPPNTILLGLAGDRLPVLLDLGKPAIGPILVVTEDRTDGTSFLQAVANTLGLTHRPGEIEYCTLTPHPWQWDQAGRSGFCGGIFSAGEQASEQLILALLAWMTKSHPARVVLVLIDDLEFVSSSMSLETRSGLHTLFSQGPMYGVWPLVSLGTHTLQQMDRWLDSFQTRIFRSARPDHPLEFRVTEADTWVSFSIVV